MIFYEIIEDSTFRVGIKVYNLLCILYTATVV